MAAKDVRFESDARARMLRRRRLLLLGVQHDPIVGNEGVAAVAATAINAGSSNRRVLWQGTGHGAAIYSACALPPVITYLQSGQLPDSDIYCPA